MSMLTSFIILSLIATLAALGWGIGSMAVGGNFDTRHATQLMFARIGLQGLAIIFIIVALMLSL